jgi:hypothetical protein
MPDHPRRPPDQATRSTRLRRARPQTANDNANEIVASTSARAGDDAVVFGSALGLNWAVSGPSTMTLAIV